MWFTEDGLTPAALFGSAGLMLIFIGLNAGRLRNTILGGLLMIVGATAIIIDAVIVTAREEIESQVVTLCDDFQNHRPETLTYFSKTVPGLRQLAEAAMAMVTVESEPTLTDFQIQFTNEGSRATAHFRANATISVKGYGNVGHQPSRFMLTWAREGDGWKIIKVQRMHPIQDRELGLLTESAG